MNATQFRYAGKANSFASSNFAPLALKVLSTLADEAARCVDHDRIINVFCNALTKDTSMHRHQIVSYLQNLGLTNSDIVDKIIPAAARYIGERWVDDELTFAEVSCGAARMQELSRYLGDRTPDRLGADPSLTRMLLIIPRREQHTMGAFVAADQFRRLGMIVEIAIDQAENDLKKTIRTENFSLFGVSAASRRQIKPIKNIVDILKEYDETIPVALGGNILRIEESVQAKTNVDIALSSPSEIIALCGLPTPTGDLVGRQ